MIFTKPRFHCVGLPITEANWVDWEGAELLLLSSGFAADTITNQRLCRNAKISVGVLSKVCVVRHM